MKPQKKIGVVGGGGWLGQAIIKALLQANVVIADDVGVSYRATPRLDFTPGQLTQDSQALADSCDTIILSVRPGDWPKLSIDARGKLVISVMAGVPMEQLSRDISSSRVIRALPNVAASVGYSFTPWVALPGATHEDRKLVTKIFESCGLCDEVENEHQLDYLTGLSGSGPGYSALLAESMRAHAVENGIKPEVALRAVNALLIGTGRLLEKTPQEPSAIVQDFIEYRGVIAAAINAMKQSGFDDAVAAGLSVALQKSRSLA